MHLKTFKLISCILQTLISHESLLPKEMLQGYLNSILKKREVLLESAARFGTPQYFFDEPSLVSRIGQFKAAFARYINPFRAFYAMKSNSFSGVCRRVVSEGMGLDVSSGLELSSALDMGCKEIVFSGPGKTDEEIRFAVQNRSRVTLLMDSFGELERLSEILKRENLQGEFIRVGVRVRIKGSWNKFGIPLKDLASMLWKAHAVKAIEACGIQFHTSWNLEPTSQVRMIKEIGSYISQHVSKNLWSFVSFLDIGGGYWPELGEWLNPQNTSKGKLIKLMDPQFRFGNEHYYRKAKPLDYFAREIANVLSAQGPPLCEIEVWMEPGRWVSNPAMHILVTAVDKKDPRTVVTDGGTNLLGWERPLDEFIPIINLTQPLLTEHRLSVFGPLCTPHDIWGESIFGNDVSAGHILIIPDQGAYTYSLRQSFIKPKAKVIQYDGSVLEEVKKEEGLV